MPPKRLPGVIFLSWFLLLSLAGCAGTGNVFEQIFEHVPALEVPETQSPPSDVLRLRLEQLRGQRWPAVAGVPLASVALLDDFYRRRNDGYAWHSSRQVEDLLHLAEYSVDEGFRPGDFHVREIEAVTAGRAPSDLPPSARADAEILLSDSLLRLIHHYRYGKVAPRRMAKGGGPLLADLERAIRAEDLQAEVEDLVSRPFFYTWLKQGLARYRRIVADGGWPRIPGGKPLQPYMNDPRVPIIRERLRATGDFWGFASDSPIYDATLQVAVRTFQKRHRLEDNGVVGAKTRAAMNISAAERVDRIRINLERMRWISDRLPNDFLLVNIPEQRVRLFRNGQVIWSSRVIVGRRDRPTPAFRDQVEYLEINPKWTVPPTILKKDILPAVRKNPGYLRRKGLKVVTRSGKPVSPKAINWRVSAANFPYLIRQPPGARNALGRIKFMFPNRYSVYLHDTPSRKLFNRSKRLFSSGCVRVEHPWKLAELILNDPGRWNQARFKKIVASKHTRLVRLERPLPVVLAYWTAEGNADGSVLFWDDVYARDAAMLRTLNGRGRVRILHRKRAKPKAAASVPRQAQQAAVPVKELKGGRRRY